MPRIPQNKTPLRIFREAIGVSQKSFARVMFRLVGIAPATYKAYELGVRAVSQASAVRLMIRYGVDPQSIIKKTGSPLDIAGHTYSRSSYKNWPGERPYDSESLIRVIQRATDRLIRMLLVARRVRRFTLALQILDESIERMQEELSLKKHYNDIACSGEPFERWEPGRLYCGGAPVKQPEEAEFPFSDAAVGHLQELMREKGVCVRGGREECDRKEREFFSDERLP